MIARKIVQYQTCTGKVPFKEWLLSLKDISARARIRARIDRLSFGNFGDTKPVGSGVFELRFHFGPGYRVYFGLDGNVLVVLLLGGDKSHQSEDIHHARIYWEDYLRRKI